MARIMDKANPDYECDLVPAEVVADKLKGMLENFESKGWRVEEEQPGEHTVIDEDGRIVGIFYIEE